MLRSQHLMLRYMYEERWKYNNFNILFVVKINIAHTQNAIWLPHNHHKKFTMDKGKNLSEPFSNTMLSN